MKLKKNKVEALNDDDVGNRKEIAAKSDEPFPGTEEFPTYSRQGQMNATLADTYYLDTANEKDEWKAQLDLFADAYEEDDEGPNRSSLPAVHMDVRPVRSAGSRTPSFMSAEPLQDKRHLLRSLFGDSVKSGSTRKNKGGLPRRSPRRSVSWNPFVIMSDKRHFVIHPFSYFR